MKRMNATHRYIPSWPFPPYIFVPGVNPHPKKEGGHMEGEGDPVAPPVDPQRPQENRFLRYALDLYNHGYFWESHVYFEALWNAHKREGSIADLFKGMIKLGAGGVKLSIDQKAAAVGHFERGRELFESVKTAEGKKFLGFDLENLISEIDSGKLSFQVHPEW
ncbi:MAG TPA: DUF309 domain-containing protein [Bacteriovoracaceae bacterium]|nr:DUF309 domain-containing protein [Bacteriovoracaceae bacterium]